MSEPTVPETSTADQRRRVWQLYNAGELTEDPATVQLDRGSGRDGSHLTAPRSEPDVRN